MEGFDWQSGVRPADVLDHLSEIRAIQYAHHWVKYRLGGTVSGDIFACP